MNMLPYVGRTTYGPYPEGHRLAAQSDDWDHEEDPPIDPRATIVTYPPAVGNAWIPRDYVVSSSRAPGTAVALLV